jgi:arylsulfatase A
MNRRGFLFSSAAAALGQRTRQPNILFILIDDMAQYALSCYGNPHLKTPHIDSLARDGMKFTQAYVTPQCTPTRATLLTGQYTSRNRMWHVIPKYGYPWARVVEPDYRDNLPREAFTVAIGLQSAGYRTGCFGKWHLTVNEDGNYTGLNPRAGKYYGFDSVSSPPRVANEQNTGDKGVNRLTNEAIEFMAASGDKPFFCYLAHHTIHGRVSAPEPLIAKYRSLGFPEQGLHNATYLAALEHMDHSVGRLLRKLDELNIASNTAVFFLTDNGGVSESWNPEPAAGESLSLTPRAAEFENPPLRAGKGSSYEGGIRVPLLVRWPGTVPAGRVCETPVHAVDVLPTLLAMAGSAVPKGHIADGVNLVPLLRGGSLPPRSLFWYMPFYDIRWAHTPSAVIREGDYKLIEYFGDFIDARAGARYIPGHRLELYNLRTDIGEKQNLASRESARAAALQKKLHAWMKTCGVRAPGLNPNYDPARALVERRG